MSRGVAVRQFVTWIVIATALASLLLAVPPLRRVVGEIDRLTPGWLVAAIALELASCASFVVIFRRFFDRVPSSAGRRLAWTEMGSGALVPGGGVGALAVGGWLLHRAGMSTKRIVERSSGLFFLTSAMNILFLFGAGVALALGVAGPHDVLRDGLPVIAAVAIGAAVLALPRLMRRGVLRPRGRVAFLRELVVGIGEAERALLRPSWRLLGAIGYLGFDIAVLWATFKAVGYTPPAAPLILAYIIGYLADLIPVPGGIGVLEGGLVGTLVLYGAPVTQATAAVLVYHAVAFWIPGGGGLLAYSMLRRQLPGIRTATDDARRTAGPGLGPTARRSREHETAVVAVTASARPLEHPEPAAARAARSQMTKVRPRTPRSTDTVHPVLDPPRAGGGARTNPPPPAHRLRPQRARPPGSGAPRTAARAL
jgi:uncharacterized membrane protein YbhN (UPF0104 family)